MFSSPSESEESKFLFFKSNETQELRLMRKKPKYQLGISPVLKNNITQ